MSHPPSTRSESRPAGLRGSHLALCLLALAPAWAGGCDVEWSGARFSVEQPASEEAARPDTAAAGEDAGPLPPLPGGPFLYYVRVDSSGRALAAPAAALDPAGRPRPLELPDTVPGAWPDRFDSAFYPRGRELALHAASRRAGSLVLYGHRTPDPACPPVTVGRVFVTPGEPVPEEAVALPGGAWPAEPGPGIWAEPEARIRRFAPILAERLLGERGVGRAFLAELADLSAVPFPGSDRPGMAATYLIRDTLAPVPPRGPAVSLSFLARYNSVRGYEPSWVRIHRYEPGGGKRAYSYVSAADGPDGRVHFFRLYDETSVRLAVLWPDSAGGSGEVTWEGSERCSALRLVDEAAGAKGEEGGARQEGSEGTR